MECIGQEFVRHEFRFTPAKGKVVNIYRETYKCPECAISEEHPDDQTFVKAPVQESLIPESYASESVVGWAMHQKYQNGPVSYTHLVSFTAACSTGNKKIPMFRYIFAGSKSANQFLV